jgi:hypothetical protein
MSSKKVEIMIRNILQCRTLGVSFLPLFAELSIVDSAAAAGCISASAMHLQYSVLSDMPSKEHI